MHAIVNHLSIKPDADWGEMVRRIGNPPVFEGVRS